MDKKIIKQVRIDQSNMTSLASSRTLLVQGEVGAEFIVNVIKADGSNKESYYNFKTKSFTLDFISSNSLKIKMVSSSFQTPILFPADSSGDSYRIIVIAKQQTTQLANGSFVTTKNITQVGQTTVALEVDEGSEINSNFQSKYTAHPPDSPVSSTGSTVKSASTNIPIAWTLTNASSDTHGFGFMLPGRPTSNQFVIPDTYWFAQQIQVVNGSVSNSTTLVLDSVVNLFVGVTLSAASSGSILPDDSGESPTIIAINGNTITLSVAQSISDGVQLYFRAYGPTLISRVFGLGISFNNFVAKGTQLVKTVRTSTTFPESNGTVAVNVNGTYGVTGNNFVRVTGFNINENGNNNLVTSVSASATQGSVSVSFDGTADDVVSKVVTAGTKLYVNGSHQEVKIAGIVTINKYPTTNAKLKLDLTKIITHGVASP